MVAFNCSRRKTFLQKSDPPPVLDDLANAAGGAPLDSMFRASASHRASRALRLRTAADGSIVEVGIGQWRVLTASPTRRLAEVRELGCGRVAVRIERFVDAGPRPSSEIWQLYNLDGRLEAALQTTPDGRFALLTNYRTRQACRMVAADSGALRTVETWNI
jgi:hypothetical protein